MCPRAHWANLSWPKIILAEYPLPGDSFCLLGCFMLLFRWMCSCGQGLPRWLSNKEFSCNAGDAGDMSWIPGLGRYPRGQLGSPLQYSCLENPMGRRAWWVIVYRVAKSQTWVKWPWALLQAHDSKFCTLHANSKSILFHHFLDMVRPTGRKKITIEKIVCYNHRSQEQEASHTPSSHTGKPVRRWGGGGHCGKNFCCGFCGKE